MSPLHRWFAARPDVSHCPRSPLRSLQHRFPTSASPASQTALGTKCKLLPGPAASQGLALLSSLHPGLLSPWLSALHPSTLPSAIHTSRVHPCLRAFAHTLPGTLLPVIWCQCTCGFLREAFSACLFLLLRPVSFLTILIAPQPVTWAGIHCQVPVVQPGAVP